MTNTRTEAQAIRQDWREERTGRYNTMNPCYLCRRGVGAKYFSTQYTDCPMPDGTATSDTGSFGDAGLVLHEDCCAVVDALPIVEAYRFLMAPIKVRRGHMTYQRRMATAAKKRAAAPAAADAAIADQWATVERLSNADLEDGR